ncbi:MAG: acyltransferase [Myxococcaceae bacterium]
MLVGLPVRLLPQLAFPYLRTALYRLAGISIGARSLLAGRLELIGPGDIKRRLKIGEQCWFNAPLFADLTGDITIGDRVTIGHHVVLVTATHQHGEFSQRAGPSTSAPIVIGDGSWIGAGVTILPGVTIGAGSIIGARSVVTRDVPPHTLALGTPARAVRRLSGGATQGDSRAHSSHEPLSAPLPPDGGPDIHLPSGAVAGRKVPVTR